MPPQNLLIAEDKNVGCDTKQTSRIKVSIVIPALNEEQGIGHTIQSIPRDELSEIGFETGIIVVDNGSTDRTAEIAKENGATVVFEPRRGYGQAYKAGFSYADGEIIATCDADMTYPVESIPSLIRMLLGEQLDFITTDRFSEVQKSSMSTTHLLGNVILSTVTRAFFRIGLHDSQSGMWVFRRELLSKLHLVSNDMAFSQELKVEACHFAKCRWREVPISYRARMGTAKIRTWRDGSSNLYHLFKKRISRNGVQLSTFPSTVIWKENEQTMWPNSTASERVSQMK